MNPDGSRRRSLGIDVEVARIIVVPLLDPTFRERSIVVLWLFRVVIVVVVAVILSWIRGLGLLGWLLTVPASVRVLLVIWWLLLLLCVTALLTVSAAVRGVLIRWGSSTRCTAHFACEFVEKTHDRQRELSETSGKRETHEMVEGG